MPKQAQTFLQQGDDIVTVAEGQVPVFLSRDIASKQEIVSAVNFLRSGCPEVQIVYPYGDDFTPMHTLLQSLQRPGEVFDMRTSPIGQEKFGRTYQLLITRTRT